MGKCVSAFAQQKKVPSPQGGFALRNTNLGSLIKQQRIRTGFTLPTLAAKSGVSQTHLSRIEKAQRYPSANILRKIAQPLGLEEKELFSLAGYLSPEEAASAYEEKHKLRAELDILTNRVIADTHRIKKIVQELQRKR